MNILELLEILFLVVIIINAFIGMWAVITAHFADNKSEVYSPN